VLQSRIRTHPDPKLIAWSYPYPIILSVPVFLPDPKLLYEPTLPYKLLIPLLNYHIYESILLNVAKYMLKVWKKFWRNNPEPDLEPKINVELEPYQNLSQKKSESKKLHSLIIRKYSVCVLGGLTAGGPVCRTTKKTGGTKISCNYAVEYHTSTYRYLLKSSSFLSQKKSHYIQPGWAINYVWKKMKGWFIVPLC
jgi:hypothetical protein